MQRAVLYGTISEQVLSHVEAEHLAEDAGRKALFAQGEQIREYTIVAEGVQIENRI
jgi:predicted kinase